MGHTTGLQLAFWWGAILLKISVWAATAFCFLGASLIACIWDKATKTPYQHALTGAVLAIFGLLLMIAGMDAAVWASADTILTTSKLSR